MSWAATDAVWELFDATRPDGELKMMLAIGHHYNDAEGCSRASLATLAKKCRRKERWATELRNRCIESGDVHVITKGGKGPGDPTSLGLAPKYVEWINARLQSRSAPLDKNKGAVSSAEKGAVSSAKKGAVPHREKRAGKYESKRKQAAAASAVAGSPPPLLPEPNPADIAKFQAEFERVKGRPLLGAK